MHTRLARLTWQTIDAQFCRLSTILLSHPGVLGHDPGLFQQAEETVKNLSALISADRAFDIIGGTAGCLAALLSLYTVAPSASLLTTALQCGDHLLNHAQRTPQGIGWRTTTQGSR